MMRAGKVVEAEAEVEEISIGGIVTKRMLTLRWGTIMQVKTIKWFKGQGEGEEGDCKIGGHKQRKGLKEQGSIITDKVVVIGIIKNMGEWGDIEIIGGRISQITRIIRISKLISSRINNNNKKSKVLSNQAYSNLRAYKLRLNQESYQMLQVLIRTSQYYLTAKKIIWIWMRIKLL